jgi:hypothetical protein
MQDVTIIYWRDIPAQVMVGRGRKAAKRVLSERFEQAIDRAAMKVGARDSDAYLEEWRRDVVDRTTDDANVRADEEAARLEKHYDMARLKALIDNEGRA